MNLFWLNIRTRLKILKEYFNLIVTDYRNPRYRHADVKLLLKYFCDNPFEISKNYAIRNHLDNIYTYGETPIPVLRMIVEECKITEADTVYELGCGRGRACLWLRHIIGCRVTGIDCIDEFIRRATSLQDDKLTFIKEDFLTSNFSDATVIYLYGTTLSSSQIRLLTTKLEQLPAGTKVITISYPLTHFCTPGTFSLVKSIRGDFHWGTTDIYYQVVNN